MATYWNKILGLALLVLTGCSWQLDITQRNQVVAMECDDSGPNSANDVRVDSKCRKLGAVRVKLAYAIGKPEPVMAVAEIDESSAGSGSADASSVRVVPVSGYDLSPRGIATLLQFDSVRWADTAVWGHFGREFSWG